MPNEQCKGWFIRWTDAEWADVIPAAYATLSKEEFAKGIQLGSNEPALRYFCSRLAVRHSLSRYVNNQVLPQHWLLVENAYGKLALAGEMSAQLDFSVTHTHRLVVCAVTDKSVVGIDVEPKTKILKSPLTKTEIFSKSELTELHLTKGDERKEMALKMWTMKEACAKATNDGGLRVDPNRINVRLSDDGGIKVRNTMNAGTQPTAWQANQHIFLNQYFLSIAAAT